MSLSELSDDVLCNVVALYLPIDLLYSIRDCIPGWILTFSRRMQEPNAIKVLSLVDDVNTFSQIMPTLSSTILDPDRIHEWLCKMYQDRAIEMIRWMINNGYLEDFLMSIRYEDVILVDSLVDDIISNMLQNPDRVGLFVYYILGNRDVFGRKFYLPIFERLLVQDEITEEHIDLSSLIWLVRDLEFWKLYNKHLPLENFIEMLDADDIHTLSAKIAVQMAFLVKDKLSKDVIKRILREWYLTQRAVHKLLVSEVDKQAQALSNASNR